MRFGPEIYSVNGMARLGPGSLPMCLNRLRMGGVVLHVNYRSKPPTRFSAPNGAGRVQVRCLLACEGGVVLAVNYLSKLPLRFFVFNVGKPSLGRRAASGRFGPIKHIVNGMASFGPSCPPCFLLAREGGGRFTP